MESPKISIITVTRNCAPELRATIGSVVAQTYSNLEYIIIDGGSTDGSLDVISENAARISYWVSEPDKGIFDAMNKGLQRATGEWCLFMNAGDRFADGDVVERVFATGEWAKDVCAIHGLTLTEKGIMPEGVPFYDNTGWNKSMEFCHQSVFVRCSPNGKLRFDTLYKVAADYAMLYSLWRSGGKFCKVDFPIAIIDTTGVSAQNRRLQRSEVARINGCERDLHFILWTNYKSLRAFMKRLLRR